MPRIRRTHCKRCGVELDEFTGYRKATGRWHTLCKACAKRRRRGAHDQTEAERRTFVTRYVCDVCGQPERQTRGGVVRLLNKDHDHLTGEWRGLLCSRCNQGIGLFKDNPELLRLAAAYLENPPGLVLLEDDPPEARQAWRQSEWYLAKYGPWSPDGTHPD